LYVRLLLGAVVMKSVRLAELIVALAGIDDRSNFTRMRLFWLPDWLATWIVVAVPKFVVAAPWESWESAVEGCNVTVTAPAGTVRASEAATRRTRPRVCSADGAGGANVSRVLSPTGRDRPHRREQGEVKNRAVARNQGSGA